MQSMAPAKPPALTQVDTSFWEKYRAVENGAQIDILNCARDWSKVH